AALALGIGLNSTIFSIGNALLFKNLPFKDSSRVLYLTSTEIHQFRGGWGVSYPDFLDIKAGEKSFSAIGAYTRCLGNFSDSVAFPENYNCTEISANGFSIIGKAPILGRDFLPEDERPGAAPVAILSYGIWESRYAKDAGVVGRGI